jgi:hypothetical protein
LRELSSTYQGLTDLLENIQNNMPVIRGEDQNTGQEDENSTRNGLGVKHAEKHRRLSSGNIARKLGGILDLLESSERDSIDSEQ